MGQITSTSKSPSSIEAGLSNTSKETPLCEFFARLFHKEPQDTPANKSVPKRQPEGAISDPQATHSAQTNFEARAIHTGRAATKPQPTHSDEVTSHPQPANISPPSSMTTAQHSKKDQQHTRKCVIC